MALRAILKRLAIAASLSCVTASAGADPAFVPVFQQNFPDPFVLLHGSEFVAYSTNDGPNVPMATSPDLVNWRFVTDASGRKRDALPRLGSWAKTGFTWAPEVLQLGGRYLLYYTASDAKRNAQCIGVAEAADPLGPFVDSRNDPIVCQTQLGGSIDADAFKDADGKLYLYFKNDGNRVGKHSSIWAQQLSADGLSVSGEAKELIHDDQGWEQKLVEAPTMVRSPIGYELFFSAAFFGWNDDQERSPYGMGYATCSGPLGPCKKSPTNPMLHSFYDRESGCISGPGHQSIFTVGQRSFMSFHAWEATSGCRKAADKRYLYIAPIFWKDGKPQLGPSLR
ncbi:glycoside hydrolase family 43 protein [Sphingomonas limnosediminicola]|uniref:Glycoside hydrolase family 43 protein n=1 Tax=Sphingomonas limnosediminicola TaxID=940133 RepID=A0ABP7KX74_9SPHN